MNVDITNRLSFNKQQIISFCYNMQIEEHKGRSRILEIYKRKLLFQVIAVFSVCLLVILERIFYSIIVDRELDVLSRLQLSSDLTQKIGDVVVPNQITNGFLLFFMTLSQFRVQFLLLTHLLTTLYVSFDALIATKVSFVSFGIIYIISLLQMLYSGARPFWASSSVLTSNCLQSYNHPSLGVIFMFILPAYIWWNYHPKLALKNILISTGWIVVVLTIQFLNYFLGSVLLINLALGIVVVVLLATILRSGDSVMDKIVRKSTILRQDSKRYSFYWLLLICLLQTLTIIIYTSLDTFVDLNWLKNYMRCTKLLDYPAVTYRYDEVVGPWFSFTHTATAFGWIAFAFAASYCFRTLQTEWYSGSRKKKFFRGLIANACLIPSWLFIFLLQNKGDWVVNIGLNAFLIDALHYFVLYLWLFGYLPTLVFTKLKLINVNSPDCYVIIDEHSK